MKDISITENKDNGDTVVATGGGRPLSDTSDSEGTPEPKGTTRPDTSMSTGCWKGSKPQSGRDLGVWESSLEDRANILSRWMLSYLTPLLSLGSRKVLDEDDIGVPTKDDRADRAHQVAMEAWKVQSAKADATNEKLKARHQAQLDACKNEQERKKVKPLELVEPSIALALLKGFGVGQILLAIFYYVVSALLGFVPVLILNELVQFFESGVDIDEYQGRFDPWLQVAALGVLPFLISLLQTRHSTTMAHCAVFVRTSVSTMLYRKALRVSASGRAKTSTGQVVNMMSNDTAQLQRFLQFVGMTLVAPLQIIIALVLIFQQVGNATWVGVGFMFALAPINTVVFSIVSKQRRKVLKYSDLRVKMMNEILAGIRIIKFYAWERPFGKEVGRIRGSELKALTKLAYTSAIGFSLILMSAPLIQPILVFLTYVSIQNEPLDAATAFTTVALFNIMRFPFAFMPMGLLQYIQSKISLKRLERYLALPELDEYVEHTPPPSASMDAAEAQYGSVTILNGSFAWMDPEGKEIRPIQDEEPKKERRKSKRTKGDETSDVDMMASNHSSVAGSSVLTESTQKTPPITLQELTCTIQTGKLVAIVGAVGSGKSSFLSAILGEMEPVKGCKVYMPRPVDAPTGFVSYCTQTPWVVNDTLRGNVLFGRDFNQERYERVLEACALVDDLAILPAGDLTEIGERGINLSGGQKARVALARALYSDETRLMLMDDPLSAVDAHVGEHIFSNAIAGDMAKGITRLLVTHHVHLLSRCDDVIVMEHGRIKHQGRYRDLVAAGVDFAGAVDVSKIKAASKQEPEKFDDEVTAQKEVELSAEKKAALKKSGKKLVRDEEREEGSVDGSAYMHYARAGGLLTAASVFVIQALGRASEVTAGFWLALWAERSLEASLSGDPFSQTTTNRYLGVYALFGLGGVIGLTARAIIVAVHRLRASKKMHDDLTESILRAPVSFFDITPTGRILNRFAADMDKVDLELTQSLSQGVSTVFSVLGAIGAIIAATNGTFLVPLIPIGYLYYLIQKWFRKTSTELQRINSIANSPIFADFSQTLSGTSTIRAYGEEKRFFIQCKKSFDNMNTSYILVQLVNYWLGLRLDVLGGLMGAFIGGVAVATSSSGFISAGWLGLALSYSIEMTNYLKHGVRMIATIEAQMNSVERILFYTNNIKAEAPEFIPECDPEPGVWPINGEIELSHASMRYRDGPLVLKDLSLKVKAGERVGVCGRTGSGKSSLMICLFRIAELEDDGGKILIDGIDASEIGTSALRLNLSIIPQDPVIFSNTVRYNLDPFSAATDEEVWESLTKVQMADTIAELPNGLSEQVSEGGENFSQGQRQLLCIARSLIRKPKILVMDEATASIDNATDSAIQRMIRENFENTTVLTIAHRLNTIMDSDRVLVLDDGRIAEFDTPEALLAKKTSLFRAMVDKSRAAKSKTLIEGE
jgi:ATP-binding cassette subfamily C (CFTR/MRP) protein 1